MEKHTQPVLVLEQKILQEVENLQRMDKQKILEEEEEEEDIPLVLGYQKLLLPLLKSIVEVLSPYLHLLPLLQEQLLEEQMNLVELLEQIDHQQMLLLPSVLRGILEYEILEEPFEEGAV